MIQFEVGEKIIKILRRHYLAITPAITMFMFFAIAPIFLYSLLTSNFIPISQSTRVLIGQIFSEWKVFGYSIWLLILWNAFFVKWTDYYLDIWIITDRHVIDVEQKGFFRREITSFRYEQIQDITVETSGLIQTLFKFGTLQIETAGHERPIIIKDANHPEEARALILKIQEKLKSIQDL